MSVDWDSPTWGHNPIHHDSHGSWLPDAHTATEAVDEA